MIHPQYIVSLVDFGSGKFIIRNINNIYKFEFNIYCKDIKILYKIKDRFKIGKIIIKDNANILKINKQLDIICNFFLKNKLLNTSQHILFLNWLYLYNKLIIKKDNFTEKEVLKISRRLKKFSNI